MIEEKFTPIRHAVAALCAGFPGEYWRALDRERAYPTAFVAALTEAGYLAALIPEAYGGSGLPLAAAAAILWDIHKSGCNGAACHAHIYTMGTPTTCIYNPVTGHEKQWADPGLAPVKKKVVVVGGGPAGMEAARVAAERGHQVVLFEASDRLGGEVKLAMLPPMRESFEEIIKFFERQLPQLGVEVRLYTEATVEKVLAEKADAVIVATGATPYVPDIPGAQGANVITSNDVLTGARTGQHVVIIDTQGTPPGCVVAEVLADQGKRVEIVTGLNWVGSDSPGPVWHHLYERLLGKEVVMSPMTGVSQIGEDFVDVYHVVNTSVARTIQSVDTVVMAAGGQANDGLYNSLAGRVDELYVIGDSAQPRNIEMATYQAHKVAAEL